jgi:predicted transcriptional regulator
LTPKIVTYSVALRARLVGTLRCERLDGKKKSLDNLDGLSKIIVVILSIPRVNVARTPQDVTDAELAILEVLWAQGRCTRRQITDLLYPDGGPAHYTTVQKLLERLEAKGHVSKSRDDHLLTFQATTDREQLISRRLLEVADKLCGGSLTPLLMNLVRAKPLTATELQELQDLIKQLSRQTKGKDKSR